MNSLQPVPSQDLVVATPKSVTAAYAEQLSSMPISVELIANQISDRVEISEAARAMLAASVLPKVELSPVTPDEVDAAGMAWNRIGFWEAWDLPGPVTPREEERGTTPR